MVNIELAVRAGRVAEHNGWPDAVIVDSSALADQIPSGAPLVVVSEESLAAEAARILAALVGAGRSVALVTDATIPEAVSMWLPSGLVREKAPDTARWR